MSERRPDTISLEDVAADFEREMEGLGKVETEPLDSRGSGFLEMQEWPPQPKQYFRPFLWILSVALCTLLLYAALNQILP